MANLFVLIEKDRKKCMNIMEFSLRFLTSLVANNLPTICELLERNRRCRRGLVLTILLLKVTCHGRIEARLF